MTPSRLARTTSRALGHDSAYAPDGQPGDEEENEQTYEVGPLGKDVAHAKACPHEEEKHILPGCMHNPLADQGHEHGADGESNQENERHDDAVGSQNGHVWVAVLLNNARARAGSAIRLGSRVAAAAAAAATAASDEWISVGRQGGLCEIHRKGVVAVVV